MPESCWPADTFGDPFELHALPLPRHADGYAVQKLGTDQLLDIPTGQLLPVRSGTLRALCSTFALAHAAASRWVDDHPDVATGHDLAIVPASFDHELQRHVLIYGVLSAHP